jgi:hypothetical protein
MSTVVQVYQDIANLNLWFKLQAGDQLTLADVPAIIPLRWTYFSDTWNQLLPSLLKQVSGQEFPDLFKQQLNDLTNFVDAQRNSSTIINPFSDSSILYRFYTVFDYIKIQSINLSVQENTILQTTITTVSQYTKNDFLGLKKNLSSYRDAQADIFGLTDLTYNSTYDRSPIASQKTVGVTDIQYLATLENTIKTIDFILANLFAVDTAVDPFTVARANANNPDINIGQYSSGQLVRFNYEDDLEKLATRYLGDPAKWIDIAIANGLQPPYIDEIGQNILLQSNGNGNQINIAGVDSFGISNSEKFYINQTIFLQSNTQKFPNQRSIINIKRIPVSNDLVLTLDGDTNLNIYTTVDNASILVYAPHTINSSLFILIPSTQPLPNPRQETMPWFLAKSAEDEKRAGIDLLLSSTDDLMFTSNHDLSLSYGLQNDVQAMRLKIVTELGELRYHPGFGLVDVIGNKNSNLDAIKGSIIGSLTTQVSQDSRFDRIETLDVFYNATKDTSPIFVISMEVRLAGASNQVIPISFNVNYT